MKVKRLGLMTLTALLFVLPGACGVTAASEEARTYRYRMTVEVETPEGLKTGSSVIQVIGDEASQYALSPGRLTYRIFGEAVAVDLPNGKKLFALLSKPNGAPDNAATYAPIAYDAPYFENDYQLKLTQWLKKQHGVAVLPPHDPRDVMRSYMEGSTKVTHLGPLPVDPEARNYPMLVTFGDLNDPRTVVAVDARHIDRTFGQGFKLRRILLQMTDAPVTRELEKRLRWIDKFKNGGTIRGDFYEAHRELNLGWVSFIMEQR